MISELLKSNTTLTKLDLGSDEIWRIKVENDNEKKKIKIDNWIEDSGSKMLIKGLKSNSTLTELDLGCDEKE